ncbi:MAG: malate synthase A, partial [Desulfobacterales bacterium]
MAATLNIDGIEVLAPVSETFARVLTPEALRFVGMLAREFEDRRRSLLERRRKVQQDIDNGRLPDFLSETRAVREGEWQIAPVPDDLQDRRVEITG